MMSKSRSGDIERCIIPKHRLGDMKCVWWAAYGSAAAVDIARILLPMLCASATFIEGGCTSPSLMLGGLIDVLL